MQAGHASQHDGTAFAAALPLLAGTATPEPIAPCDEADTIARARNDPAAFAPLYERYVDAVYGYCRRRVSDPDRAADLTAQIFTRALAAMPGYVDRGDTFRSWLFAIAHNLVVDSYRTRREIVSIEGTTLCDQLRDRDPGPEEHALRTDLREALREALATLTDGQREVVELRLAGLTGPEIARVLGMKIAAVKSIQFRAYAQLRKRLAPYHAAESPSAEGAEP
jgi:RNA polymerase sigma factor (sigma-70 family)